MHKDVVSLAKQSQDGLLNRSKDLDQDDSIDLISNDDNRSINKKHELQTSNKIDPISLTATVNQGEYHYKRWIWTMFPWACMPVQSGESFSNQISKCYKSATRYVSVYDEAVLTKESLKIAQDYKKSINVLLREEDHR